MPNQSTIDKTAFEDVTRSVDQLCGHLSMANVNIPTFKPGSDVIQFVTSFEVVTSTLSNEQRVLLLNKAFTDNHYQAWFEFELKPLIEDKKDWSEIKNKIIDRFSPISSREKHVTRLRELKYNPEENQGLLLFVENMLYSYKKVFTNSADQEASVEYIKAALPQSLKSQLFMNTEFREAKDEKELRKAAQLYDRVKTGEGCKNSSHSANIELASLFRDVLTGIRKDNEANCKAIVAAIQQNAPGQKPIEQRNAGYDRSRSPMRYNYSSDNRRPQSPVYRARSPSPRRVQVPDKSTDKREERSPVVGDSKATSEEAFNSNSYFAKFGKPPRPCVECNYWHWDRHCIKHLN